MNTRLKFFILMLLVLAMVVSAFAGCGDEKKKTAISGKSDNNGNASGDLFNADESENGFGGLIPDSDKDKEGDGYSGIYTCRAIKDDSNYFDPTMFDGFLKIKLDGKGKAIVEDDGEEEECEYIISDGRFVLLLGGAAKSGTIKDGIIVIDDAMWFVKNGVSLPAEIEDKMLTKEEFEELYGDDAEYSVDNGEINDESSSEGDNTVAPDESSSEGDNTVAPDESVSEGGKVESKVEVDTEGDGDNDALYQNQLPTPVDMHGREFYILQRWFGYGKPYIDFQGEVIWEDSEDGTLTSINAAKKKVLDEVQKAYNCTITGEMSTDSAADIRTYISEDILGGTAEIDFCFESYYYYYAFVEDGLLTDLNDLGIDFSQAWWDQNAVEDLSLCGELYYALGDINTYDNDGTFVLLFNKDLYTERGGDVQKLYDMALNETWTFEAFKNEIVGFGEDANSDGVRDEFDIYGLLTETSNLYNHFLACGSKIVDKNAADEPIFDLASGTGYAALTEAVELYNNTNDVLVANLDIYTAKYPSPEFDVYEKTVTNAFKEGRGLFYMTSLIHLPYFRDMEDDFGFLPIPKYNATDNRYYHNMGAHTTSVLFVPVGANAEGDSGLEMGILLDALGAYSKDYLTPEYYEKQLKRSDAKDPDSAEVLDLVFGSRVFDLGQVFGGKWSTTDIIEVLDTNIQSRVDSQKDLIEASISLTVQSVKEHAAG